MSNEDVENAVNPIHQLYKAYYRKTRNRLVMLSILLVIVWRAGVPHLQWTYSYTGERDRDGYVHASQKIEAWYVSVTGWQHVQVGDYGTHALPVVFFIPLENCIAHWFSDSSHFER